MVKLPIKPESLYLALQKAIKTLNMGDLLSLSGNKSYADLPPKVQKAIESAAEELTKG